ncbi:hypothetical protein [Mammaliicoccus sciuri]|uniref:hypothetical protein n=1 Tax=Mammaliicoccus sciuri TaxID=1296 RepID=UPI002DBE3AD3|nr:hypothetical protein [Mammaliicoccus sciuri]MEB8263394.1 hypothetical protein [Mammaliicoccus sciuri]
MNDLKIRKFIKQLLFIDSINENDLAYEFNHDEKKYYIYHDFSDKLMNDMDFSIDVNKIIDENFNTEDIDKFDLVGNKRKLKLLVEQNESSFIKNILTKNFKSSNENNVLLEKTDNLKTNKEKIDYENIFGVAS